jgi:multiple sugar transport system ATP-binding protein
MVFETYALYPHKTVFDNMAYPLRVRKTPGPEIDQKVRRAAEILEIEGFLDRYPRQLSGGQKQRVAIGRAIVREPKVFLMDEPISHLDAKLRSHMRGELKHLHKELNQTFIYVSHDQTEAMAMADRIAVMNLGVLQQFDTPQNIFNKPVNTFVAGFVGDPPMNFLPSLLTQSGDKWVLKFDGFTLKVSEKIRSQIIASGTKFQQDMEVILGARPEHVILKTEKTGEEDMAGQIYITEPLGSYMIVDVMLGGERIKVRTDVGFDVQPDDRVFVELPSDKIQLFDAKTSYSIIHPRSSTECEAG